MSIIIQEDPVSTLLLPTETLIKCQAIKQGFIFKKNKTVKLWQKRYARLYPDYFEYFKKRPDDFGPSKIPDLVLQLRDYRMAVEEDVREERSAITLSGEHHFVFQGPNDFDQEEWARLFTECYDSLGIKAEAGLSLKPQRVRAASRSSKLLSMACRKKRVEVPQLFGIPLFEVRQVDLEAQIPSFVVEATKYLEKSCMWV